MDDRPRPPTGQPAEVVDHPGDSADRPDPMVDRVVELLAATP
ncbi:MAG: hypothetical protein ACRDRZ_18935 [Pseudonocardiaceae bacterium]